MTPLLELIEEKVLPWANPSLRSPLIVARSQMSNAVLPPGVALARKEYLGKRVASRGPRRYGNASIVAGTWPDDHLIEVKAAKLICVVSGGADFRIGEYLLHCEEGSFIVVPAGIPHDDGTRAHLDGTHLDGGRCDLMWFQRWGRGLQCKLCHSQGKRHRGQGPGEDGFVLSEAANQILDLLAEEGIRNEEALSPVCYSLLFAFLQIVERELKQENLRKIDMMRFEPVDQGQVRGSIEEAQQYIRTHLNQKLTLEKVAQKVYMSRTQFAVQFRRETGLSFVECVTRCRIDEARSLLRETDWSIARIGQYVGVRSPSYFNKLIVRAEGMSPGEFRLSSRRKTGSKGQGRAIPARANMSNKARS